MTFPQRITHSPGRNIGFRQRVFKWLHKKPKSNLTLSEELNKMSQKTPLQDSHSELVKTWNEMEEIEPLTPTVEDSIKSYREAAKSDALLFGDYDGYEAYREDS